MPTRREFCQSVASAAAAPILAKLPVGQAKPLMQPYRTDRPLLDLQQDFVDLRFGMFLHFNMATYQDREWGDPTGPTELFDPTALDTDQWAEVAKSAGMTFGCLTTKHHDGFSIWPTKTKVDSILQTPKKLDVVGAYVDSFRKAGLKPGLYYSILDLRHDIRHFNITREKIQLIKDQLAELLTGYGEIPFIIFDGWDAPWSRIPYDEVPFEEIYAHVKQIQPNCLVCDLNASQYPEAGLYYTDIKSFEQNAGQIMPADNRLPALTCVTLTDGWFWKQSDARAELKSTEQILEWLVPQNERFGTMVLNAAPNREGKLAPNLVARLAEIGREWKHPGAAPKLEPNIVITTPNRATGQAIRASNSPDTFGPDLANDGKFDNSWCPEIGFSDGWLEVTFAEPVEFNTLALVEPVGRWGDYAKSRIDAYEFLVPEGDGWRRVVAGEHPHEVQMHSVAPTRAEKLRLEIKGNRDTPHIAEVGVYNEPRS